MGFRVIEWFNIEGDDALVGKEVIDHIPEDVVKAIALEIADEDDQELHFSYTLNYNALKILQNYLEHTVDIDKYEYFISTYKKSDGE